MTGSSIQLQSVMDEFVSRQFAKGARQGKVAESCMELLADYLLHYSDLFQDKEPDEAFPFADWEEGLDEHMAQMLEGDVENVSDLGTLPLSRLEGEHLKDFLGWHLLRELGPDTQMIRACGKMAQAWVRFILDRGWLEKEKQVEFLAVLAEILPESERVSKAAQLLLYYVRLGSGMAPRFRGQRFSSFYEGHARVEHLEENRMFLHFDNTETSIGPVMLPEEVFVLLKLGDVLDVELGQRGEVWQIVDIGPVYPTSVYIEAEEFDVSEKLS